MWSQFLSNLQCLSKIECTPIRFSWIGFGMTSLHSSGSLAPVNMTSSMRRVSTSVLVVGLHFINLRQSSTLDADGQLSMRDFLVP